VFCFVSSLKLLFVKVLVSELILFWLHRLRTGLIFSSFIKFNIRSSFYLLNGLLRICFLSAFFLSIGSKGSCLGRG
jgi:hypothetical protein